MGIMEDILEELRTISALLGGGAADRVAPDAPEKPKAAKPKPAADDDLLDDDEPAPAKAKPAAKGKKASYADLTAACQPIVNASEEAKAGLKKVLLKFGLKRLGDAKEEQYGEVLAAIVAYGESLDGGASDDEDDVFG